MKGIIFKHYLRRSLTEPIGIMIITGLPTLLIFIISMVIQEQVPDGISVMWNGYNTVSTNTAIMFMVSFQFFGGNALLDYIHQDFRGDRKWRMFSMPVTEGEYLFGILAACFLYCVLQGGLVIGITALFLDVYWGNPLILIATLCACSGISQLLWLLLFMLFPKKGTVEALGQLISWGMMFASGLINFNVEEAGRAATTAFNHPILQYATPISLARNVIINSGFMGKGMDQAFISLGILYALLAVLAVITAVLVQKKGFSTGKNVNTAAAISSSKKVAVKIQDSIDIANQPDLILTPSHVSGSRFTIYRFALLRACRNPLSLLINAVLPLVIIFIPVMWQGKIPIGYSLLGVALMYGSFIAARGILNDKLDGTITRIFTAPVTSFRYLAQNLLAAITPLMFQIVAAGLIGRILYQWEIVFTFSLLLIYTLFAMASVSFSFAWSCLFKKKETSFTVFSILTSIIAMLGGFFMPLQILPDILRYIGALFPAFWLSNGVLCLQDQGVMGTYWISAAAIVAFIILYMIFGSKRRII